MKILSRLAAIALFFGMTACAPISMQVADIPAPAQTAGIRAPVTMMLSIDAFRPDYLYKGDTPNLDALAKGGIQARMQSSFPTLTFPNHEALVTGLRPDNSGIVANTMFDPAMPGVKFYNKDVTSLDPFWWKDHDPVWISAEKQGVRSGVMFWPGSEVAHGDVRPSDWIRFDANFTEAQRVRTVIDWLRRPADIRPKFVAIYFDSVDRTAHKNGATSPPTLAAVREVDAQVGALVAGLKALGQPVNLLIVSDHGMRDIDLSLATNLDDLIPRASYRAGTSGPFAMFDPLPGHEREVEAAMLKPHPHATCWRKGDLPARFHYGTNIRVGAIVCLAEPGGSIVTGTPSNKGEHGYDMEDPLMQGVFIANGPAFRTDAKIPSLFDNVDLYPMLTKLIGIRPEPNDGDATTLDVLVKQP